MPKSLILVCLSLAIGLETARLASAETLWAAHGPLRITADGHYLEHADGTPFFLLADTAWHLRSLSEADIDVYLKDRAAKRFNVVMADFRVGSRSRDGALPESHWVKNDYLVDQAARHGLYVVVIAGWGSSFKNIPPERMRQYGQQLGDRYKDRLNVIYFVAAEFYKIKGRLDGKPLTQSQQDCLAALGKGLREADPNHLISIHGFPNRGKVGQPSTYFQKADWCDFYGVQTHNFQDQIRTSLTRDWNLTNPTKPTFNAEAGYEDCDEKLHPWLRKHASNELFRGGWGQRFQAYWSVFYGGCGFAYGHDYLWCMQHPDGTKEVLYRPALDAAGAKSMRHLRALMEEKITSARPDPSLIVSDPGTDAGGDKTGLPDLRCAIRGGDSTWAMVYSTIGKDFTVELSRLAGKELRTLWFDPRKGTFDEAGRFPPRGKQTFDPPGPTGRECDWVLVLETDSR